MRDVAIIGAGELGGALAHALARRSIAREIRLLDPAGRIAEGKALDISQAAPIEHFSTIVAGSADVSRAAAADVVVVADRVGAPEWKRDEAPMLFKSILAVAPRAVVVCAGAGDRDLVELGVAEQGLGRTRLFGSAAEAFTAAARAIAALEANASPRDVVLATLGVPPSAFVIPWDGATIAGFPATAVLDEAARRRVHARLRSLWPPGAYALAEAAAKTVAAIFERSRQRVTAFVAPAADDRARMRTAALPVVVGPGGIERVVLPPLTGHDRVSLDNAIML